MKQASMERKILSYSISLALCLLMFLPLRAQNGNPTAPPQGAPPKKEKKDAKEEVHYPLYNGMSVGLDLWGIGSSVFGGDFLSSEVAVDVTSRTASSLLPNWDMAPRTPGVTKAYTTKATPPTSA